MENEALSVSVCGQPALLPLLDSLNTRFEHSFSSEGGSELDQDRCYLMEIEQLKRENNFLKRKLAELTKRHSALAAPTHKRSSLPAHIKPPPKVTALPDQNYLLAFFEEITRLLESFAALFSLGPSPALREHLDKQRMGLEAPACSPEELERRLGRVLLQPEEERYGALLEIFEGYYREAGQVRSRVEGLTTQAIELGKSLAERVRTRERSRTSRLSLGSSLSPPCCLGELSALKESFVKSTCTDSLELSGCRELLARDKMFENIF